MDSVRYKRLTISSELLFSLFTEGAHPEHAYTVISDPIPSDAQFVEVRTAWPHDIELLISSESFPDLRQGQEIPLMMMTLRRDK